MALVEAIDQCTPLWQYTVEEGTTAEGLAQLLKDSVVALRNPDDEDGTLTNLSSRVLRTFKTLPRHTPNQVGRGSTYHIGDNRLHRRTFMDSGGYNRVFRCEWVHGEGIRDKAVLRFVRHDAERDEVGVLMAYVETCMHMLLTETGCVVPIIAPLKVERTTHPGYDFGAAIVNPGHGSLYDLIRKEHRTIDDARIFPLFLLVIEILEKLQESHQFVHRDCKTDNIMVVSDPGRTSIDAGEGVEYPIDEKKLKFIDFGYSEVRMSDGERIASDAEDYLVSSGPPMFNDSTDITYFAYITLEDNRNDLSKCPRFIKMLNDISGPLYKNIKKHHKNYQRLDTDDRNEIFLKSVYKYVKHGKWGPAKLRKLIREEYWTPTRAAAAATTSEPKTGLD
jgi:hypothetical protein